MPFCQTSTRVQRGSFKNHHEKGFTSHTTKHEVILDQMDHAEKALRPSEKAQICISLRLHSMHRGYHAASILKCLKAVQMVCLLSIESSDSSAPFLVGIYKSNDVRTIGTPVFASVHLLQGQPPSSPHNTGLVLSCMPRHRIGLGPFTVSLFPPSRRTCKLRIKPKKEGKGG